MISIKQTTDRLLRMFGLRKFADNALFAISAIQSIPSNRTFRKQHPEYAVPPLSLMYDAFNHTLYHEYLDTGLAHARDIAGLLKEHIPEMLKRKPVRICEWGCGPAKILRNLQNYLETVDCELAGTDYNSQTIQWCNNCIRGIRFFENKLAPPLPFDEGTWDVIIARSVFTHLSLEMHIAWIEELMRVLKEDGAILLTTHGNSYYSSLLPHEKKLYESGKLVTKASVEEGKKFYAAVHPPQFVRKEMLGNMANIVHIEAKDAGTIGQDVWIARK